MNLNGLLLKFEIQKNPEFYFINHFNNIIKEIDENADLAINKQAGKNYKQTLQTFTNSVNEKRAELVNVVYKMRDECLSKFDKNRDSLIAKNKKILKEIQNAYSVRNVQ